MDALAAASEAAAQARAEFEEEHAGEDGPLAGLEGKGGIPKGGVQNRVMELKEEALDAVPMYTPEYEQANAIKRGGFGSDGGLFAELDVLHDYLGLVDAEARAKKEHKDASDALTRAVISKYPDLSDEEIKTLVVDDKWFAAVEGDVRGEIEGVAQTVAGRVKALEERYAEPLPEITAEVETLAEKVEHHLEAMGLEWRARV